MESVRWRIPHDWLDLWGRIASARQPAREIYRRGMQRRRVEFHEFTLDYGLWSLSYCTLSIKYLEYRANGIR